MTGGCVYAGLAPGDRYSTVRRADSGFYAHSVVSVCRKMDVAASRASPSASTKAWHNVIEGHVLKMHLDAGWSRSPIWMSGARRCGRD